MFLKRFLAVFRARNKEFLRDRGALGWSFLFPVLVVFGFAYAFSGGSKDLYKVGVTAETPREHAFFSTSYVEFVEAPAGEEGIGKVSRHQLDMLISEREGRLAYWINSSSPKGYFLEKALLAATAPDEAGLDRGTVEGGEIRYVDWLISGLLAMNIMFNALFGVGYTIVRYRKNGVLRRLKATPLSALEFLSAQVLSRFVIVMTVTVIVYFGSDFFIGFRMEGSYLDLFFVFAAGSACLISLGLLMAARTASEELAGGLLNLISWPMMFLSGVWFSLEGAQPWVRGFAQALPLTHMIDAARKIMTEGAPLSAVWHHVAVLVIMATLFLVVGAGLFRWDRR